MNAQTQITASSVGFLNVESFEFSQRVANMLSNSTLVPEDYRAIKKVKVGKDNYGNMQFRDEPNPNGLSNCIVALNMANRMGADPLMIMQNLYLIEGRPSWSSQFIMASINSCGRFSSLRFEVENLGEVEVEYQETVWNSGRKNVVTKTLKVENSTCVAWAIESGTEIPSFSLEDLKEHGGVYKCCKFYGIPLVESSKISVEMAVKEGWYMKNGSKWKTMPEQMLRYRAASFFGRVYAPELLMGLRSVEEEQDRIIDVTPDKSVSEQADANQLKREILGVKSPAALDEIESKVLMLTDDAKREDLLKMVTAQAKKFQPVAQDAVAKKPEPEKEEAPPVEEVKKTRTRSAPKVVEEAQAVESIVEQDPIQISQTVKMEYMVAITGETQLDAIAILENEINKDSRLLDNHRGILHTQIKNCRRVINEALAKKTEAQSPAVDPIKSQSAKSGLKNQIANASSVDELKEIAATVRDYKLKLTNDDMGEVLADYAARKKFLEDQQDMFAGVDEVSYVDAVIKRIQNAKSQDDINAEYADPAFDELSGADRERIDKEAQQRESELQD